MSKFEIYHNPACSKSRQTLSLLQSHGIEPVQHLYLQQAPDEQTVRFLLLALNTGVRSLLRSNEMLYTEYKLDNPDLTEQQLIDVLVAHPGLLQRPIVVAGDKAVIARPPENVLSLINGQITTTARGDT